MAKERDNSMVLLRWSEHVPASDVQDPLGLGLRGSARLASQLMHCVTSITPRARYFSFIPWCVLDWQKREKGQSFALGLRDAITIRERALTLGCIASHDGKACSGGSLVGSIKAAKWYAKGQADADLRKLSFAKNPALSAYLNSLVNLGFFVTQDEGVEDSDEELDESELTFDDLELSPLGKQLAELYDSQVSRLACVRELASPKRVCPVSSLSELGKRGGLCELSEPTAPERQLLRDIFFARLLAKGESHSVRRRSLLLILELCRQLSAQGWILNETAFAWAVYFGELVSDEGERIEITWPDPLVEIATRWRMFYFHHYMAVALEGMFAWLVTQVSQRGLAGASVSELVQGLDNNVVRKEVGQLLGIKLSDTFGALAPRDILGPSAGGAVQLDANTSRRLDEALRVTSAFAEHRLEDIIRNRSFLQSPVGLAVPLVLLGVTLARYARWEGTQYGNWLANASHDPYLDLVPPVLTTALNRRFETWWDCTWRHLAEFVLSRHVVQQHQSMSYEKTATGDRCLLQVDGQKVMSNAAYDKIGMGNPRLGSAIQVLTDLGLLVENDDGIMLVTKDGTALLREELARKGQQ